MAAIAAPAFIEICLNAGGGGGGNLGFQVTGMIEWSQKSIPKKIPRASSKTQTKSLDQKLTPKNPMLILWPLKVPSHKEKKLKKFTKAKGNSSDGVYGLNWSSWSPGTKGQCRLFFCTQKNPRIENLKPKKILLSSPLLEIPSTRPPWGLNSLMAYSGRLILKGNL